MATDLPPQADEEERSVFNDYSEHVLAEVDDPQSPDSSSRRTRQTAWPPSICQFWTQLNVDIVHRSISSLTVPFPTTKRIL